MVYPTLLTMWGPNWEALYYKIASYNRINRNYVAEQPHDFKHDLFTYRMQPSRGGGTIHSEIELKVRSTLQA
jgi:hypothetical protein